MKTIVGGRPKYEPRFCYFIAYFSPEMISDFSSMLVDCLAVTRDCLLPDGCHIVSYEPKPSTAQLAHKLELFFYLLVGGCAHFKVSIQFTDSVSSVSAVEFVLNIQQLEIGMSRMISSLSFSQCSACRTSAAEPSCRARRSTSSTSCRCPSPSSPTSSPSPWPTA